METVKRQNVGIFGGTFDPVHQGHLAVARQTLSRFQLDTVLFIPAPSPPHKERSLTPFAHRVAMLEAAIGNESGLGVSILEAERPSPSYTVETLEELHRRLGPCHLYLIIGADMFTEIESWYRCNDLFRLADLIVAARPGVTYAAVTHQIESLPGSFTFDAELQSWRRSDGFQIYYLPDTAVTVSSSQIRQMLVRGEPVDNTVPEPVIEYIHHHHLYGVSV